MSEQTSGPLGPARDEATKRQQLRELQARGEQWPDPEETDEPETDAAWAPEGRFAGTPGAEDWQAIELRSDLARHLGRAAFPATRAHLLQALEADQAGQRLLDMVSALPGRSSFATVGELARALGLPVEERPS